MLKLLALSRSETSLLSKTVSYSLMADEAIHKNLVDSDRRDLGIFPRKHFPKPLSRSLFEKVEIVFLICHL